MSSSQLSHSDVVRLVLGLFLLVSLVLFLWNAWQVLLVLFAGVLLAILLRSITNWVAAHTPLSPGWSYAAVILLLLGLAFLAGWFVGPRAVTQLSDILKTIPTSLALARSKLEPTEWGRHLIHFTEQAANRFRPANSVSQLATTLTDAAAGAIVVVVVAFFVAMQPDLYRRGFLRLVPEAHRRRAADVLAEIAFTLHWWILGQLVPMVFLGAATIVGLWLMNIPLAFTLGLFTGLMIFIPYLGALLAEIPAVLIALVQGPAKMLEVIALYLALHIAEGYLITPWVQRRAVELPPALTIISQMLLFQLAGLLGLMLATPLTATVLVLVKLLYLGEPPKHRRNLRSAST